METDGRGERLTIARKKRRVRKIGRGGGVSSDITPEERALQRKVKDRGKQNGKLAESSGQWERRNLTEGGERERRKGEVPFPRNKKTITENQLRREAKLLKKRTLKSLLALKMEGGGD